jgi:UDP-N-acetyl-D-mannosaminuronic acid dehydrogenase
MLIPILERSTLRVSVDARKSGEGLDSNERGIQEGTGSSEVGIHHDNQLYVAHCPERVLPGRILEELIGNDRVIGGSCRDAALMAKELYSSFVEGEILVTDPTTAEMVKLMENTFRDVNIALANELALVAERVGTNVWESIALANRHPRVQILTPGPGVGGHCIAVDPWFIAQVASDVTPLIRTARQVNADMPQHAVDLIKEALAKHSDHVIGFSENRSTTVVACLGLAYKGDVDDVRESPAIKVLDILKRDGFEVRAYDGLVKSGTVPEQVNSLEAAVNGADVIIVLTDHAEFQKLYPSTVPGFEGQVVIDTRHVLPAEEWTSEGRIFWRTGSLKTNQKF